MGFFDKVKAIFGGGGSPSATKSSKKVVTGKITHFNYKKGYGFVEAEDIDTKVFLHVSELSGGRARKGKTVEFKPEQTEKGIKATQAVVLN